MYDDALKLISSLAGNPEIENIYFLKRGRISIKFKQERTRLTFNEFSAVSILELLEVYEDRTRNEKM